MRSPPHVAPHKRLQALQLQQVSRCQKPQIQRHRDSRSCSYLVVLSFLQDLLDALRVGRQRARAVTQVVQDQREARGVPVDEDATLHSELLSAHCQAQPVVRSQSAAHLVVSRVWQRAAEHVGQHRVWFLHSGVSDPALASANPAGCCARASRGPAEGARCAAEAQTLPWRLQTLPAGVHMRAEALRRELAAQQRLRPCPGACRPCQLPAAVHMRES